MLSITFKNTCRQDHIFLILSIFPEQIQCIWLIQVWFSFCTLLFSYHPQTPHTVSQILSVWLHAAPSSSGLVRSESAWMLESENVWCTSIPSRDVKTCFCTGFFGCFKTFFVFFVFWWPLLSIFNGHFDCLNQNDTLNGHINELTVQAV